jgi:toxin FitB
VHLLRDAGELTKWTILRSWGPRRLAELADWRRGVVLLPFDGAVATTWGELQARAMNRGRPRPVNDNWIAACCLVNGLPLATFNTKDFADIAQYDGLELFDVS